MRDKFSDRDSDESYRLYGLASSDDYQPSQVVETQREYSPLPFREAADSSGKQSATLFQGGGALDSQTTDSQFVEHLQPMYDRRPRTPDRATAPRSQKRIKLEGCLPLPASIKHEHEAVKGPSEHHRQLPKQELGTDTLLDDALARTKAWAAHSTPSALPPTAFGQRSPGRQALPVRAKASRRGLEHAEQLLHLRRQVIQLQETLARTLEESARKDGYILELEEALAEVR